MCLKVKDIPLPVFSKRHYLFVKIILIVTSLNILTSLLRIPVVRYDSTRHKRTHRFISTELEYCQFKIDSFLININHSTRALISLARTQKYSARFH